MTNSSYPLLRCLFGGLHVPSPSHVFRADERGPLGILMVPSEENAWFSLWPPLPCMSCMEASLTQTSLLPEQVGAVGGRHQCEACWCHMLESPGNFLKTLMRKPHPRQFKWDSPVLVSWQCDLERQATVSHHSHFISPSQSWLTPYLLALWILQFLLTVSSKFLSWQLHWSDASLPCIHNQFYWVLI